ncbi:MAG: hypothetical protein ABR589_05850 [Chthoniobacterales bacterium]
MLRPRKFRPFETMIVWSVGVLLLAAGLVGVLLAVQTAHWRVAAVSAGVVLLATLYLCAARRGKPQ